ncbi:MAG: MmcQ/YjbR family DNA-binding protein [Bacteroidota bacterium]
MDIEQVRLHCLSKKSVTEGFPFGEETLVFKVEGKMFALIPLEKADRISLKCDPEYVVELREKHEEITSAWHMNKKHWNTVILTGNLPDTLVKHLVNHSYERVVAKLPKSVRQKLKE